MKYPRLSPLAAAMALAGCPLWTHAAEFTVDSIADSGPGSLRDTIAAANAAAGAPHDIYFNLPPESTITLTSGQIDIDRSMTLHGPGRDELTISGNNNSRIFRIESSNLLEATISGMTLTGGRVESSYYGEIGAAILVNGHNVGLTVSQSLITGNQATANAGGGIGTRLGASLTCHQSEISDNTAGPTSYGGGIDAGGDVTLNQCDLIGNEAGRGGAISVIFNHLEVQDSTISGNTGTNGSGGILLTGGAHVYYGGYPASADIINSVITNNSTGGNGGCIAGYFADIDIKTTLISGCEATYDGGGIYLAGWSSEATFYGSLTIGDSSNMVNNYAGRHGGGISAGLADIDIKHSLFDNNMASQKGGALHVDSNSLFALSDIQFDNNQAENGAAIHSNANRAGSVIERVSMFQNQSVSNTATFENGGELLIADSLIASNEAAGPPGMKLLEQAAQMVNTTIANNQVTITHPYMSFVSGLSVDKGDVTISNSTVAFNYSASEASAVLIYPSTTLSMTSTLVAMNTDLSDNGETSQVHRSPTGTVLNGEHNLVGAAAAGLFNGVDVNNLVVADPLISPLTFNGGNFDTVALQQDSPARNAGLNPLSLDFDQRGPGFPRVSGPAADIGAFEFGPSDRGDEIFADRFE